jgi:hypothetical protein
VAGATDETPPAAPNPALSRLVDLDTFANNWRARRRPGQGSVLAVTGLSIRLRVPAPRRDVV